MLPEPIKRKHKANVRQQNGPNSRRALRHIASRQPRTTNPYRKIFSTQAELHNFFSLFLGPFVLVVGMAALVGQWHCHGMSVDVELVLFTNNSLIIVSSKLWAGLRKSM